MSPAKRRKGSAERPHDTFHMQPPHQEPISMKASMQSRCFNTVRHVQCYYWRYWDLDLSGIHIFFETHE